MQIRPFIPSLCILGMGVTFIGLGLNAKRSATRLASEGVSHAGTITRAEVQKGSKGKKRYLVRVNWGEGDQTRTDDPFSVTKTFYLSRVGEGGVVADPSVTLRCFPGDPDSAVLVGGSSDLGGMEWLGDLVAATGGFLMIRTYRRVSRTQ